ncbi:TonB-dependent receptor domain-containing protein [Apibacter sp. HY039]|uniref:TonB-dependent receptor domain-containing protein n=1 Tax=Apibacter sp. HY039 TaxID=2501476 RepID=UPI0013E3AB45|nr:TonB-dependent receptor [Apibacter sp. HY039]
MSAKIFITFLSTALLSIQLFSQTIKVSGTVFTSDHQPVPYASITLIDSSDETKVFGGLANADGNFNLDAFPGEFEIMVEQAGFEAFYGQKTITKDNTSIGEILLKPINKEQVLEGVVVEGSRPIYKVELDKKVYDVSQDLTAKTGTLSDVMQNVPSVSVDVDGTVSLRGNDNVKILIDGKPSAMLGINDTAEALKSISADMVDRIEVVTNASARYEASGTAGIINIITKKNRKRGLTGNIQTIAGSPQLYGTNINLGYGKEKWNWFTNVGFRYGKNEGTVKNYYEGYDSEGNLNEYSFQNSDRERERTSINATTGVNINWDQNNSLSTSVGYKYSTSNYLNVTNYDNKYLLPTWSETFSERTERQKRNEYGIDGNLNYTHNFAKKGNTLTLDGTFNYSQDNSDSRIYDKILGKNTNDNTQTRFMLKSDYVLPIKEGSQFEAGVRADYSKIKTNFVLNELNTTSNVWIENPEYTDNTNYEENVLSAYLQYGNHWGDFSFLAGLREETSYIKVQSFKDNSSVTKNYTDLFPTLHLNYDLTEKSQLQISYSRRINRPNSRMLNPYKNISNDRNTRQGNPDLNPSYTNSFELGYNLQQRSWGITPSVYYQRTQDPFQSVTSSDQFGNLNTMPINIGHENRYGGELSYTLSPYKWWKIFGDVNLYQYESFGNHVYNKIDPVSGENTTVIENLDKNGFTWRTRLTINLKLPENFNFQMQGNYMGPVKSGQSKNKEMYGMNLGISKDIFKGQGTLLFNVQDVFQSRKRETETFGEDFYKYADMRWRPRQFTISFTYRFSKEKSKNEKRNKSQQENGSDFEDVMQ